MTSFSHWKTLNNFEISNKLKNFGKIVNMSKNIVKFYRYEKYFSDIISAHFMLTLIKGEIFVYFLK